jgi:hypothetical protein
LRAGAGRLVPSHPLMARKDIRPSDTTDVCDVCGRTLLRGERADPYLHGGVRKLVCELCRGRAVREGWIPEDESLGPRAEWASREPRRSILGRLRGRRDRPPQPDLEPGGGEALLGEPPPEPAVERTPPAPREREREPAPQLNERERHVHAVPTSEEMKHSRALDLFNASEHPRSVAGIARSLGPPMVTVRADGDQPSIVSVIVAWELSWYRYEVDLADEAGGVRIAQQGTELEELEAEDQTSNAAADERGLLALS